MLQIDHVYEFLYQSLFKDFDFWYCRNGVVKASNIDVSDICIFTKGPSTTSKIFFYDQEPLLPLLAKPYLDIFDWEKNYTIDEITELNRLNQIPFGMPSTSQINVDFLRANPDCVYKQPVLVTSEYSVDADNYPATKLYYFFHGFAALDWYRGFYALNYNKPVIRDYSYDYITFNRIVSNDRSYRCYFVSKLVEHGLLAHGQVSFGVTDEMFDEWQDETADPNSKLSDHAKQHIETHLINVDKLVIDNASLPGSASADIPRCTNDSFWHIVTETVFYYPKLHLTEKIFKPIVSKQPFMLLAGPGNLAYLKWYGFKTFDGIIDESYDSLIDDDARIDAVVDQLNWYCKLSAEEKQKIIQKIEPIVEYNFHHFYGEFKHIIARELLDNTKNLFSELEYDDSKIDYQNIFKVLVN